MRWARALVLPLLMILVVACGSPAASDGGNGNGNGNGSSDGGEPTATAAASEGGNGNGNGNGVDLDQLAEDLTPPNSTETSRTEAGGVIFLTWESSDSPEDLADWYEDAIAGTGYDVFSRTSSGGAFSFIFGIEEGSNFGGVVSIAPSGTGSGSGVGLQIGESDG